MKNLSTGTGLALLATAIVAYPIVNRISSVDQTAHASLPLAAIAAAATAQANPEPTIVWYGASDILKSGGPEPYQEYLVSAVQRAWSNGRVEMKIVRKNYFRYVPGWDFPIDDSCSDNGVCSSPWFVVSDPTNGYSYRSDITADQVVDGADLATMLADWGDAPRYDIPPSDCPLNLINP